MAADTILTRSPEYQRPMDTAWVQAARRSSFTRAEPGIADGLTFFNRSVTKWMEE
jgi:hypothetical protein